MIRKLTVSSSIMYSAKYIKKATRNMRLKIAPIINILDYKYIHFV